MNPDDPPFREALLRGDMDLHQNAFWYWLCISLYLRTHPDDRNYREKIKKYDADKFIDAYFAIPQHSRISLPDTFEKILQEFPGANLTKSDPTQNPEIWTVFGRILMENPWYRINVKIAIEAYQQAVTLDLTAYQAWLGLGYAHRLWQRQFGLAWKAYEIACNLNGKNAKDWYHFGLCLFGSKLYEHATRACRIALKLDPLLEIASILLKNALRLRNNPTSNPRNGIFLDDTMETYPKGIIVESLPGGWDYSHVFIRKFVDEPTALRIDFLPVDHPLGKRNVPREFKLYAEDNYDYQGPRRIIPPSWDYESEVNGAYNPDADVWYFINLHDAKVTHLEKIAILGKLIDFHYDEIDRLAQLYWEDNYPSKDRDYYLINFGFDPAADRHYPFGSYDNEEKADGESSPDDADPREKYHHEAWFPLLQDPKLHAAGIKIGARVTVCAVWDDELEEYDEDKEQVHNEILFQCGTSTGRIECTHTIIFTGPLDDALAVADDVMLQPDDEIENHVADLPPPEHFAALKSYVASIAELGVENILHTLWRGIEKDDEDDEDDLGIPFGFNTAMQIQVFRALRKVSPSASIAILADWIVDIIDNAPSDWILVRRDLFEEIFSEISPTNCRIITNYIEEHISEGWLKQHRAELQSIFGNL